MTSRSLGLSAPPDREVRRLPSLLRLSPRRSRGAGGPRRWGGDPCATLRPPKSLGRVLLLRTSCPCVERQLLGAKVSPHGRLLDVHARFGVHAVHHLVLRAELVRRGLAHPSGSEKRSFIVTLASAAHGGARSADERARQARAGARVEPGRNGGLAGRRRCGGASGCRRAGVPRSDCARERRNAPSVSENLAARIVPSASGASARRAKRRAWVCVKAQNAHEITKHAVHFFTSKKNIRRFRSRIHPSAASPLRAVALKLGRRHQRTTRLTPSSRTVTRTGASPPSARSSPPAFAPGRRAEIDRAAAPRTRRRRPARSGRRFRVRAESPGNQTPSRSWRRTRRAPPGAYETRSPTRLCFRTV